MVNKIAMNMINNLFTIFSILSKFNLNIFKSLYRIRILKRLLQSKDEIALSKFEN